jgi:hypothetical protein
MLPQARTFIKAYCTKRGISLRTQLGMTFEDLCQVWSPIVNLALLTPCRSLRRAAGGWWAAAGAGAAGRNMRVLTGSLLLYPYPLVPLNLIEYAHAATCVVALVV